MQQSLLSRQLPCCASLPRCLTSIAASTSASSTTGLAPAADQAASRLCSHSSRAAHQRQQQAGSTGRPRTAVVARITGKREEYVIEGIPDPEDIWGEEAEQEFIEIDNTPIWSPERGPVGERIFRDADEERDTKEINIEDTAYWFAENNGGELPRTQWARRLKEIEPQIADEMLACEDVEGLPPRLKLSELEEGDELVGIITDIWLWHGALVDVLADYKGLIPIRQTEWPQVHDSLLPGTQVLVRVHKVYDFPKYRFPLQLELLAPEEIPSQIMQPSEYRAPANVGWLYEQGMDIQEVAAELGIPYEDQEYSLEPDHGQWAEDIAFDMGKDDPNFEYYPGDWLSRELEEPGMREQLQEAATREP